MKTQTQSVIGIDIAKQKFDAVHLPTHQHLICDNNKDGIKNFLQWARKHKPTAIVCEVTALAGLAPYANQSGMKEGKQSIYGG